MKTTIALILSLLPVAGFAHNYTLGDLKIAHPIARDGNSGFATCRLIGKN